MKKQTYNYDYAIIAYLNLFNFSEPKINSNDSNKKLIKN